MNARRTYATLAVVFLALLGKEVPFSRPCSAQEKPAKLAELNNYGDFLNAEGVWRADNLNEKTENAFPSVTRLECYKHGGKDLVGSDSYCMQANAEIVFGHPHIGVTYYPVIAWDKDRVIAADSPTAAFPICIWSQLTINLRDHSIMATDTRKLGKGHEGLGNSCEAYPLAQTYHLVDSAEEFARRDSQAPAKEK